MRGSTRWSGAPSSAKRKRVPRRSGWSSLVQQLPGLDVYTELLEESIEGDPDPPEAVEEEEEPERDKERAADEPDRVVAVAKPAGGTHRAVEADPHEDER